MKLFTKIVATIMFMAVLMGTFSNVIIGTAFYLEQEYIAKEKCENRNKPMAHCNGKCYLKKQLQKEEKREAQGMSFEKQELVWFQTQTSTIAAIPVTETNDFTDYYSSQALPGHLSAIYHPPAFMI